MGNCVQFQKSYIQLPAITSDFRNGFSAQVWINPSEHRENCHIFDLGRGKEQDNIFLSEDKKSDNLAFAVYQGGKRDEKLLIPKGYRTGVWTHVTVTVDAAGNAKGYLNGTLVADGKMRPPKAATDGIRNRCFIGRSNWKDDKQFLGMMADLRVWTKVLSDAEIAANYATTLVGDEDDLLGYWPLSGFEERGPVDLGRSALHGSATDDITSRTASDLPLKPRKAASVLVKRELRMDYIPYSAFPSDRALCGVAQAENAQAQLRANIEASGTGELPAHVEEGDAMEPIVTCPVWELTLEPEEDTDTFDLTFDRDVDMVSSSEEGIRITRQEGGHTASWKATSDGLVRLRFPAGSQLELPGATLRTPGGGATRLDFPSIGTLTDVTPQELTSDWEEPETLEAGQEGTVKPTAIPGTLDAETTEAVTLYIRQMACATPMPKFRKTEESTDGGKSQQGQMQSKGLIKDLEKTANKIGKGSSKVFDDVSDLAKSVGDGLEDVSKTLAKDLKKLKKETVFAAKGASKFVVCTAEAASDLIKKAPKVVGASPVSVIEDSIRKSAKLCVSSVNAAANVVEMVGETLDGKVFRVIIQGVQAAVAAMRAFFERAGLFFRDLAAWLASLLKWFRFREPLDTIHDFIKSQLTNMRDALLTSGDYIDTALAQVANTFPNQKLANTKLGSLIPIQKKALRSPELDFVLSHVEDALHAGLSLGAVIKLPPLPTMPTEPILRIMGTLKDLPLDRPFDLKCGNLIEPLAVIWNEVVDAVRETLLAGIDAGVAMIDWLRDFLTSRIKLPFFTPLFENVLFPGWKLTPLRLITLWAAIPALLTGLSLSGLKDMKIVPSSGNPDGKQDAAHDPSSRQMTTASVSGESASGDRQKTSGASVKGSSGPGKEAEIFLVIMQSIGLGVSMLENGREMYLYRKGRKGDNVTTGFLMFAGGFVGLGIAYSNWYHTIRYMQGERRQTELATAGLVFDFISSAVRTTASLFVIHEKKTDISGPESVAGAVGFVLGLASTALATTASVMNRESGGGGIEQECATSIWILNAVTPFLDGTSFFCARMDSPPYEAAAYAGSVGSLACATTGCALASYLVDRK